MITNIALEYFGYGLSVVPVSESKLPTIEWKNRQSLLIKPRTEFNNVERLAIVCGAVSGGLEIIDIDLKYDVAGTLIGKYKELVNESDPTLLKRLLVEKTQNSGYHFIYRYEATEYEGNLKLASRYTTEEERVAKPNEKVKVLLETRGEGGYFVAAPSVGYTIVQGSFANIPVLTLAERNILIACARSLNEVKDEIVKPTIQRKEKTDGLSPLDDYNERGDVLSFLCENGWSIAKENSKNYFLKREGSDAKWGATLHKETNVFYVFSSSTQFDPNKGYSPSSVYGTIKHATDWSAAARDLAEQGYGDKREYNTSYEAEPQKTPEEHKSEMQEMFRAAFIDITKKLDYPKTAISIGEHTIGGEIYPTTFGTYGNFSCIVGASKSKKTFFKSLLTARYIGGSSDAYSTLIRGHRRQDLFVLDIDTEQGEWHAQNVFKRIPKMVGGNPDFYKPFALRPYSHTERIQFIEYLIYESEFKDNIGLLVIDGLADLVADFNDLKESNAIIQRVMKWTDDKMFHLMTIVHQNSTTSKATGHLGSSILKKAETVCNLANVDGRVDVSFPYTRGFPINNFSFEINQDGLPYMPNNSMPVSKPQIIDYSEPRKNNSDLEPAPF